MSKQHGYQATITWTGNKGTGTSGYSEYNRDHEIMIAGKPLIPASSDPSFRGDPSRYNPEELLVASLSSCHMLWYLHLCAEAGITVTDYSDTAIGSMAETGVTGGHFVSVTLHPAVIIQESEQQALALSLHDKAHSLCFIANSVNFPVTHHPDIKVRS